MADYVRICEQLHNVTRIPMLITDREGQILAVWPKMQDGFMKAETISFVLMDFIMQRRDRYHPLLSYLEPGYFIGVAELELNYYAITGLVSPYPHSRQEILSICAEVITPACLQLFCDLMLQNPTMNIDQMKDFLCLLTQEALGENIPRENVQFNDFTHIRPLDNEYLEQEFFLQREEAEFHVSADFGLSLC